MESEKFKEDNSPKPSPEQISEDKNIEKRSLTKKEKILAGIAIAMFIGKGIGIGIGIDQSFDNIKTYNKLINLLKSTTTQSTQTATETSDFAHTTDETTIATVDSTPDTQSTTSTIETQPITTSPEINNSGSLEIFEQTISVEVMDNMNIEEFAKVSYVDRAAYAYMKNPEMDAANINEPFDFDPKKVIELYRQKIRLFAAINENAIEGAKTISALAYYTTDKNTGEIIDGYRASADSIINAGGTGNNTSNTMRYVSNGATQTGEDRDGNNIEYTNITYQYINQQTDEPEGPLKTSQILQVAIKLDNGRTIIAYPAAYTIEGQQSPDNRYPY